MNQGAGDASRPSELPMARKNPSQEEKCEALGHIGYELVQTCGCAHRLRAGAYDEDDVAHNALLESMLLHARSLIEFFVRPAGRIDDMALRDFVPNGRAWPPGPDAAIERLKADDVKQLMDKHMAHLTWARIDASQPLWTYHQIAEDLLEATANWCEHLRQRDPVLRTALAPSVYFARQALNGDEPPDGLLAVVTDSTN